MIHFAVFRSLYDFIIYVFFLPCSNICRAFLRVFRLTLPDCTHIMDTGLVSLYKETNKTGISRKSS